MHSDTFQMLNCCFFNFFHCSFIVVASSSIVSIIITIFLCFLKNVIYLILKMNELSRWVVFTISMDTMYYHYIIVNCPSNSRRSTRILSITTEITISVKINQCMCIYYNRCLINKSLSVGC